MFPYMSDMPCCSYKQTADGKVAIMPNFPARELMSKITGDFSLSQPEFIFSDNTHRLVMKNRGKKGRHKKNVVPLLVREQQLDD